MEQNTSLISIILPVYNGQTYIKDAIESIITQTHSNFELIIVNDCSTDNTLSIINSFALLDERIKIITNPENLKLPASLNAGHNKAKGNYVTWTSDDNTLKSNFLESLIFHLKKTSADVVYSNFDVIFNDGTLKREHIAGPTEHLLFGDKIGASFLYKKEVFNYLKGYDESLFLAEDYDFWLRASLHFKFHHIDENIYQYRLHSTSLTSSIQGSEVVNEKHGAAIFKMFKSLGDDLLWKKQTVDLLVKGLTNKSIYLKKQLLNFKQIKVDILKFNRKELKNDLILEGLFLLFRKQLLTNKENQNLYTLINVLSKQKLILFHKSFSKKTTLIFIKKCFLHK